MTMQKVAISVLFILILGIHAWGQGLSNGPYTINPLDLNSGGLVSSSRVYEIGASEGQAGGVGVTSSGPYEIRGGFWAAVPVGAPIETPTNTPVEALPTPTPTLDTDGSGRIDSVDLLTAVKNLHGGGTNSDLLLLLGVHWYQSSQ